MNVDKRADAVYIQGHSKQEQARLIAQAQSLAVSTRRLLQDAGLVTGMKVLDVGSGAGDVALLAADLVGAGGTVVGIDSNAAVIKTARERVLEAGLTNLSFVEADFRTAALDEDFDAVIGRFVLMYQGDPPDAVRSAMRRLRPDGLVVFQEYDFTVGWMAVPPSRCIEQFNRWTSAAAPYTRIARSMGFGLYQTLLDAGLSEPQMRVEAVVGGGHNYYGYRMATEMLHRYLPTLLEHGIATAEEVNIDTFEERLRTEVISQRGVVMQPLVFGAWAHKPAT